jgi:hypothetical protein
MNELPSEFVEKYAVADKAQQLVLCRDLSPGQKVALGVQLFEREREIIKREIRRQMPEAPEALVQDALRLAIRMVHPPTP